ncbi:MAG: DUF1759 domain-containing protein, partial [Sedimenticola sp.]
MAAKPPSESLDLGANPPSDKSEPLQHTGAIDLGARQRTMTEKGLEYQISLYEQKFKSAISAWRRNAAKALVLLSDTRDTQIIREQRNVSQQSLDELSQIFQHLQSLKDNCTDEAEKLATIEIEHQQLMQDITACIRDIEYPKSEVSSHVSSRSARSDSARSAGGGSARSAHSSRKSNVSKVSDALAREAALKTELKYIDIESQYKTGLKKIETIKKMELARAEISALEGFADTDLDIELMSHSISLPDHDPSEFVNQYVRAHAQIPVAESMPDINLTAVNVVSQADTVLPPTLGASSSMPTESVPRLMRPVQTYSVPRSIGNVSFNLNPGVPSFVPESIPQASTQNTHANIDTNLRPGVGVAGANVPCSSSISNTEQGLIELAKSLADQVSLSRLPAPEPSTFTGDPLSYPGWKSAFQTLIERRQIPPSERIHYLKRYLAGPVREVIEGYLLLESDEAYEEAKRTLDIRYGDPFVIANAFRDKLEKWPKVAPRDGTALQKFGDFLQQCQIAMQSIGSLSVLNDDRENRRLLTKLPDWMVSRWGRIVSRWRDENGAFPPFSEFVVFVTKEAKIACDPVTSLQSLKTVTDDQKVNKPVRKQDKRFYGSRSFVAETVESGTVNSGKMVNSVSCTLCKKPHDLDNCRRFLAKSLIERKGFAKDKGLCFACLQGEHIARRCRQRKKCKVCSKFHPTSLHGDIRNPPRQMDANATDVKVTSQDAQAIHTGAVFLGDASTASKCSMIVPVYISHRDSPTSERLVYALLDTQSDTSFILEDTCEALGITGAEVKLSLSTMHAENKVVSSQKIKGLVVRGFDSESKISLPDAYTRNLMPANRSHIPTPDMARLWPHLEPIADNLVPLQNCEIGLLIGYNCAQALVPREVIASSGDGPYGQKTDLGWSIVGVVDPCCCENDSIGLSHRILSREVSSSLTCDEKGRSSPILFSLRTTVKEVVSSDLLALMEREFSDSGVTGTDLSEHDRRFLTILSEGIHYQDGHYEMPLPFRDKDPSLPNNKYVAQNRLKSLRRKLEKEATFRRHYSEFMQELIKNGHAEQVPASEVSAENGRLWYIPHHGVYHPQKPDKIRVVFDCSSEFQGVSLNAHLLQGPDLANRLVGVLCRFRKEPVAIMCDVEKMFYQFRVNSQHRDYLRFLWWDSEDYSKEPVEYRMTVHLFGATSSPGCSNFGFKRTA